ncbi:probable inactive purple acid phosphatase 16 isoform X2 [Hevea brasiliensis]|uniref:probable inactive purple acid phosphatase 16 isoform X2 n=1 Tax=Hevea brasiliensis TaxID=3981 RepID=UPI0025DF2767|nr:probable inactive purple acid phosphatase 16 isoform X2 [Hevea brasiliensis]
MEQRFLHLTVLSCTFLSILFQSTPTSPIRLKTSQPKDNGLRVNGGGSFKVALFADLHFGEDAWTDWGPQQDVNSIKVMSTVLDHETPDFVIYLGDVITANNMPIENATLYWDQAISPTEARGIPWASVFGNHDDALFEWPMEWFSAPGIPPRHCPATNSSYSEEYCSFRGTQRIELMKNEIEHDSLSFSKNGPKNLWPSVSNYVLQVASSSDPESTILIMYFLDSGGGSYPEVISSAQAEWFQHKYQEINPDSSVPEIIFWHIPSTAYKKVAPWFAIHKPCVGSINKEKVAAQEAEFGIMHILVKRPSVKAIFVGHNHGLDWCCPYEKLWLCFARHTGYGGYGNWPRGARILEITEQPFSIKSWIRMEDGGKHSEVLLSS